MLVVSGCPRSGTSLMMQILRSALGESQIFGAKFPQEKGEQRKKQRLSGETDAQYAYRQYALELDPNKNIEKNKDLNPDGFWECPFTVPGIRYSFEHAKVLETLLKEGDTKVCKIVSMGLANSDPRFVDKIILMVRHPRAVAKSQERLRRELKLKFGDGVVRDLYAGQIVHSPEFFIESTLAATAWLEMYPTIDVCVVSYDDLIANPLAVITRIQNFTGKLGQWEKGVAEVKPQLKRSYPADQKSPFWADAEYLYDAVSRLDFSAIRKFKEDPSRVFYREHRSWMCVRCEQPMNPSHCRMCVSHIDFRDQLKVHAEANTVPWKERPCAWEVAYRDGNLISHEDSVHYNSWFDTAKTGS